MHNYQNNTCLCSIFTFQDLSFAYGGPPSSLCFWTYFCDDDLLGCLEWRAFTIFASLCLRIFASHFFVVLGWTPLIIFACFSLFARLTLFNKCFFFFCYFFLNFILVFQKLSKCGVCSSNIGSWRKESYLTQNG